MSSIRWEGESAEGQALFERVACLAGTINALHGEMVQLTRRLMDLGEWGGAGLEAPGAWVAHHLGCTRANGVSVQALADRYDELPETVAALEAGRMSLDQASVIARCVPAYGEKEMVELAEHATVHQLRRAASNYPQPEPTANQPKRRRVSTTSGGDGMTSIRADLRDDEAKTVTAGLDAELRRLHADGDVNADLADALVAMARRSLNAEESERPHARPRLIAHLNLEEQHGEPREWHGVWHLGGALPASIRRQLGCDATIETLFERDGQPIGTGRATRIVGDKLRTAIEQRDGGCRVPGCESRYVEIHHLVHWEDGGATEPDNLIALCGKHHRAHHDGELCIDGDAESATFFDRRGRPILAVAPPQPPKPGEPPLPDGRPPPRYQHPTGEPWDGRNWIPRRPPPDSAGGSDIDAA